MTKLWFKAKTYGIGWQPSSWQGWLVLLVYLGYLTYRVVLVEAMFDTWTSFGFRYSFELIPPTFILLVICYFTGEKLKWRWGEPKKRVEK